MKPASESPVSFDYPARIARLRKALSAANLHALLVTAPANICYLSGFRGSSGALLITQDRQMLFSDFRYRLQTREQAPDFRFYEIPGNLITGLAQFLQKHTPKNISFESQSLTVQQLKILENGCQKMNFVPGDGMIEKLRMTKAPEEIAQIARAAQITDQALEHMLSCLAPGKTEREIALECERFMLAAGAKSVSFDLIVASGARSALPHAESGTRKIKRGDLVVLDIGAKLPSGYCSDLTRTVAVGKAAPWQQEIYSVVYKAQIKGLKALKAAARTGEVDAAARAVIAGKGYGDYFGHGLGHGVGLEVHEDPRLVKKGPQILVPGMVVTVEPGIYLPGKGGVRIEDLAVVTRQGYKLLSGAPKPSTLPVV